MYLAYILAYMFLSVIYLSATEFGYGTSHELMISMGDLKIEFIPI